MRNSQKATEDRDFSSLKDAYLGDGCFVSFLFCSITWGGMAWAAGCF